MHKIFYLYNIYHLGDNVFNIILLSNILKDYLIQEKIKIYYYCQECYITQVSEFNNSENVTIRSINEKPDNSLELWINNKIINHTMDDVLSYHRKKGIPRIFYDLYYCKFFNKFFNLYNLNIKLHNFYYKDRNLIDRYKTINKQFGEKYTKIDILIANSQPFSDQFNYNKSEWDKYITEINNKFKVITTTKVEGINCTMDDNLTIKDIASLSIKSKVIIAVNSGVVPGLLNKYTLNNIKQFYVFDDRCRYSYPKFQNKENIYDITVDELNDFIL
jgi:hypothetical protein